MLGAMKLEVVNGVTVVTFRQSSLDRYLRCPEQARKVWLGEVEDSQTAEAAIGTAVHFAIEAFKKGEGDLSPAYCLEVATGHFRWLSEQPGFRWVKVKTFDTAVKHIGTCFNTYLTEIDRYVGTPLAVEYPFRLKLLDNKSPLVDFHTVEIWLTGTIDLIDEYQPWDWKTCSRIHGYTSEGWQLKRWAIQPTVYTWAAKELGFFDLDSVPFTYGAMQRTPAASALLTVWRDQRHWDWLKRQCWDLYRLMDDDPHGPWPTIDQHALCSPDWCPAWSQCKGAYMDVPVLQAEGFSLTA